MVTSLQDLPSCRRLEVRADDRGVVEVRLNRPEIRNAFDDVMIDELRAVFERLGGIPGLRVVVLSGAGRVFSAGADTSWLRRSVDLSEEENRADALAMARMFEAIDRCALPVVGRIQRAAFGGGCGLASVCDIAVADRRAWFGFTEVRLGIIPAVISSFALRKIGISQARRYFLTGERFSAAEAHRIGLIHEVVPEKQLDRAVERHVQNLLSVGPRAVRAAKVQIHRILDLTYEEALPSSAEAIAAIRIGDEAQEGLRAFLDKRPPRWSDDR